MNIGLRIPQRAGVDLQKDVLEVARQAESIGFASLWTFERALFPLNPKESYPAPGYEGKQWPAAQRQTADPLAILTAAAAVTSRVRLGTSVVVVPAHAPFQLAKAFATIDQISGGRIVAGLGSGWSTDELRATGATRADRGRFLDEFLDVADAVWGPDPVTHRSPRLVIENASVLPKPVSKIPVLLGGDPASSPATLRRIVQRSDGWMSVAPFVGGIEASARTWERIREAAASSGRDADRMKHVVVGNVTFTEQAQGRDRVPFVGSLDEVVEDVAAAAAIADEVILDLNLQDWFTTTGRMLETAEEIYRKART